MLKTSRIVIVAALAAVISLAGAPAVFAQATAEVTASPASIAVGETSTITATGLGGLETATFGLDATPGGELSSGNGAKSMSVQVSVSDGRATAEFSAIQAGTFTIAVGDGETPVGTTTVTVTEGSGGGAGVATVTASPPSIAVGETAMISASGLGELTTAGFGLDSTPGGELSDGEGAASTSIEARVTDGRATAEFTATQPGTFTIAVGDGETVLGTTTVTVSAAPTATPTPTPTPTPAPATDSGGSAVVIWIVVLVVLLVAAGVTIWIVVSRRRSSGS